MDWGEIWGIILSNKDWLFSGVALSIIVGVFLLARKGYLAFLTDHIDKRIARAEPSHTEPIKKIEASAKVIEQNTADQDFEIESYWGYRPAAHEDMRKDLYSAKERIFVAGGGLTTIVNIIKDTSFVKHLSSQINNNAAFKFTIIMDFDNQYSNDEVGRVGRQEKIDKRKVQLSQFRQELSDQVTENIQRPLISFKKYNEKVTPRHFLLASDNTIYIGSYLSHKEGQYSYLLKIRSGSDGALYNLLNEEIDYVGSNATKFDLP